MTASRPAQYELEVINRLKDTLLNFHIGYALVQTTRDRLKWVTTFTLTNFLSFIILVLLACATFALNLYNKLAIIASCNLRENCNDFMNFETDNDTRVEDSPTPPFKTEQHCIESQ